MQIQGEEMYDEHEDAGLRTRLGRWWDKVRGNGEMDELGYEEETVPNEPSANTFASAGHARAYPAPSTAPTITVESAARRQTFRVASAVRESAISVSVVTNFGETQKVADRLKSGEAQIVNLEKTPPDVAERLIDFLNGVTYAMDGYVERIAEGAYLFTPAHIAIHAEGPEQPQPKPFFDRL